MKPTTYPTSFRFILAALPLVCAVGCASASDAEATDDGDSAFSSRADMIACGVKTFSRPGASWRPTVVTCLDGSVVSVRGTSDAALCGACAGHALKDCSSPSHVAASDPAPAAGACVSYSISGDVPLSTETWNHGPCPYPPPQRSRMHVDLALNGAWPDAMVLRWSGAASTLSDASGDFSIVTGSGETLTGHVVGARGASGRFAPALPVRAVVTGYVSSSNAGSGGSCGSRVSLSNAVTLSAL